MAEIDLQEEHNKMNYAENQEELRRRIDGVDSDKTKLIIKNIDELEKIVNE